MSGIDGSTATFRAQPAIDYFVIDSLSLGGFLGLDYISTPGGSNPRFSIGPRVGYNIAFADRFSIWPKAGLSLATTSQHFFIGFGPVVDADLSGNNKSTTFGGRLTIGGWF